MIYSKFDVKTGMYKLYERSEGRPDVECTYTDDKGAEITLTKKDTYRCAPGRTVKRDSDGKFVKPTFVIIVYNNSLLVLISTSLFS